MLDDTPAAPVSPAPITGLSHVQLVVPDVAACTTWWTTALGLEPLYADEAGTVVALRHRPTDLVIVLSTPPAPIAAADSGTQLDHLAFAVPDRATLESWAAHLTAVGIDHPGIVNELGNPSLQLVDPAGVRVELIAPRAGRRSCAEPKA